MTDSVEEAKPTKIVGKIIGWKVLTQDTPVPLIASPEALTIGLPQPVTQTKLERGDVLNGCTYKVKQPLYWQHGFYITINNTYEKGRILPFEIFIESKNSECLALCNVLSLTLTSMFRLRINIRFLLEEYRSIQDPKGGYWAKKKSWELKPKYYTSIVGEFADVITHHLDTMYLQKQYPELEDVPHFSSEGLDEVDKVFAQITAEKGTDIPGAIECPVCHSISYVLMDGCLQCVECGHSKCS